MTRAEANRKAIELLGPTSRAIRVSSRDRNQRFGIILVDKNAVWTAGYGSSYEEAYQMAVKDVNELNKVREQNGLHQNEHAQNSGNGETVP